METTDINTEKQIYHIILSGNLDACSSILMDDEMRKAMKLHPNYILVNCKALHYISSAGLGVFISYLQKLASDDITLVLSHVNASIKSTFDTLGLSNFITILPDQFEEGYLHNTIITAL